MDLPPDFDVYIGGAEETLGQRDVELLRAIDSYGSINRAATELGRSYSRAQQRIVALEECFGDLVERNRGGSGGGGSALTERARSLTVRYERLQAAVTGVAETEETVLSGKVVDREGRLATVETSVGTVKALAPPDSEKLSLAVQADAVTLQAPDETPSPDATSARNHLSGTVKSLERGEGVSHVTVDVGAAVDLSAIVTVASVERLGLEKGAPVTVSFKATATRGVPTT
ncbi:MULTISPECIES: TOBE domain-containing protein [Salinibaculum]|uniref:TOBE domain-containing protein n=1 Tax=Salinibaculum TaxID=2732368 RepID=UPI0030CB7D19